MVKDLELKVSEESIVDSRSDETAVGLQAARADLAVTYSKTGKVFEEKNYSPEISFQKKYCASDSGSLKNHHWRG